MFRPSSNQRRDICPTTGKVIHSDQDAADEARRLLLVDKGVSTATYYCPACGFYHIGKPASR